MVQGREGGGSRDRWIPGFCHSGQNVNFRYSEGQRKPHEKGMHRRPGWQKTHCTPRNLEGQLCPLGRRATSLWCLGQEEGREAMDTQSHLSHLGQATPQSCCSRASHSPSGSQDSGCQTAGSRQSGARGVAGGSSPSLSLHYFEKTPSQDPQTCRCRCLLSKTQVKPAS